MKTKLIKLSDVAMLSISPALVFGQAQRSGGNTSSKQSASKTTTSKQQGASAKTGTSASKQTSSSAAKQTGTSASKQTSSASKQASSSASKQTSAPKTDNKQQASAPKADNKKQASAPKADNKKQASAPKSVPKGYEDKMKYDSKSGHWSYLREGKWYTYDHYIEPTVYYSRPLSEFGCALIGTVVGALISSLLVN